MNVSFTYYDENGILIFPIRFSLNYIYVTYHEQWRIQDFPLGGRRPVGGGGGTNLQCVHFSVKMYAKTKEIDPVGVGGGTRRGAPWIRQ